MGQSKLQSEPPAGSPRSTVAGVWPGALGAEPPLPELTSQFQVVLRKFATEVIRPTGRALDRLARPDDILAPESPFLEFREQFLGLGVGLETLAAVDTAELPLLLGVVFEELGWGDAGLACSVGAGLLPAYVANLCGRQDLLTRFTDEQLGCWAITEPGRGSDSIDVSGQLTQRGGTSSRPSCTARITDGKVVVQGQKSAWVSNAPLADYCMLNCLLESGAGPAQDRGVCVFLPLDLPGVSRGRVLAKMGQRPLPQSELFFDQVSVDIDNLLCGPEDYAATVHLIHAEANALMGSIFTGVARSAYDLAYAYAHERRQGGAAICRHQDVARRLFHMARKVEVSCALSRRVLAYKIGHQATALPIAMFAKTTATANACEVASDAMQIFGGNGVTEEYPVEKIFRDARISLIEDGCNEVLAVAGGFALNDSSLLEEGDNAA